MPSLCARRLSQWAEGMTGRLSVLSTPDLLSRSAACGGQAERLLGEIPRLDPQTRLVMTAYAGRVATEALTCWSLAETRGAAR